MDFVSIPGDAVSPKVDAGIVWEGTRAHVGVVPPSKHCGEPSDEEDGDFDIMFQLRHQEMLQSLLGLLRRATTAGPAPREQMFWPPKTANREHGLECPGKR
uniref:Uncharacterized protein n=1 Tax=Chelydra serpentina TaxID=8475 RepID=A0A8C3RV32_CHESE